MYFQFFFFFLHNGVRRFDEPYSKPTKTVMSYWFCTLMDQSECNLYHFLWHRRFNVLMKKNVLAWNFMHLKLSYMGLFLGDSWKSAILKKKQKSWALQKKHWEM